MYMDSQPMRPIPWWVKKWLKLKNQNRNKTQIPSRQAVNNPPCFPNNNSAFLSLSTNISASSSSFAEAFNNTEMVVDVSPITPIDTRSPSNDDDGDHRLTITEAATSNAVDDQMIISSVSSELSAFQKSDMSKLVLTIAIPMIIGLLGLNALNSPAQNESNSRSLLPENKPKFPPLLNAFVAFVLMFGITFIFKGILRRDIVPRTANLWEVVGVLLVFLSFFTPICWMMPDWLKWAPWLAYILTIVAIGRTAVSYTGRT